jgi:hypothetical protein
MSIDINSSQHRNQVQYGGGKMADKKLHDGVYDDA